MTLVQTCDIVKKQWVNCILIASTVECSRRSAYTIRSNLELFDSTRALPNARWPTTVLPLPSMKAFYDCPLENPILYVRKMILSLGSVFRSYVTTCSISWALAWIGWLERQLSEKQGEVRRFHDTSAFIATLRLSSPRESKSKCWFIYWPTWG
jgi:hypothetical protein